MDVSFVVPWKYLHWELLEIAILALLNTSVTCSGVRRTTGMCDESRRDARAQFSGSKWPAEMFVGWCGTCRHTGEQLKEGCGTAQAARYVIPIFSPVLYTYFPAWLFGAQNNLDTAC